jgi:hypothetical protein
LIYSHRPDIRRIMKVLFFYQLRFDVTHLWSLFPHANIGLLCDKTIGLGNDTLLFAEQILIYAKYKPHVTSEALTTEKSCSSIWTNLMRKSARLKRPVKQIGWLPCYSESDAERSNVFTKDAIKFMYDMTEILGDQLTFESICENLRVRYHIDTDTIRTQRRSWMDSH